MGKHDLELHIERTKTWNQVGYNNDWAEPYRVITSPGFIEQREFVGSYESVVTCNKYKTAS